MMNYLKSLLGNLLKIIKLLFFTRTQLESMSNLKGLLYAGVIILTQLTDAFSTRAGLSLNASEQNSAMGELINRYGINGFLFFKVTVGFILSALFWKRPTGSLLVILLYTAVTLNNILVISRHLNL